MKLAAIVLAAAAAGCASHEASKPRPPIRPTEWRAVFADWYTDGTVDHPHQCGAVVLAIAHLPSSPPMYSTVVDDLERAEKRSCTKNPDLNALKSGMSDADVAAAAGAPDGILLHCWLYAARRVCFTNGRATGVRSST